MWRPAAAAYTIGANGSPGVVVTPNPNTAGSISVHHRQCKGERSNDWRQLDHSARRYRFPQCARQLQHH